MSPVPNEDDVVLALVLYEGSCGRLRELERPEAADSLPASRYQSELALLRREVQDSQASLRAARLRALHGRLDRIRQPGCAVHLAVEQKALALFPSPPSGLGSGEKRDRHEDLRVPRLQVGLRTA